MRGRLRDPSKKSYAPPFQLNQPMDSRVVAKVVKSNNDKFPEGSLYVGFSKISNYAVVPEQFLAQSKVIDNKQNIPLPDYLGALGMPGLTACRRNSPSISQRSC